MNPNWQEFLTAAGARMANGQVADFGDLAAELVAARDATIIAPLTHLGRIGCTGDDAVSFLHNQLTSDVNHLATGAAQHSAWCSAKGRMLASFLLFRHDAGIHALLSSDLVEAVHKRLKMYVLRSKVVITDQSSEQDLIGLSGPGAVDALREASLPVPDAPLQTAEFSHGIGGGTVVRLDATRFILSIDSEASAACWTALSTKARAVGTAAWRWLDIQAAIPLIGDATKEAFVPQMADFDKIGGVSFHKGCYPGQEIVARTQYLGKVKRHLYRVHSATALEAGAPIHTAEEPEHPCGMICNAAPSPDGGFDALAVIQENFVSTDAKALLIPGGVLQTASAVNS